MSTFATPAPVTAVIEIAAGRVQLIATERTDTVVEVRPAEAGKGRDVKTAEQTQVDCTDGLLRIRTATPKNPLLGGGSVEVTVHLPAGSRIEGKCAAVELRTVGRLGEVVFEGAYRETSVEEAAGLRLTAVGGDVEVGRLGGAAEISTSCGDIRVAEAAAGSLVARTQKGDITVGVATGVSAALDARTTFGAVANSLKNDGSTALRISATTSCGDITARSL
ncbi:DUF4097 family beta strand repeat-containing protein [Kitasatospora viridis]|uniref:DUF4097 domain-containing protein n=1 Tax=Kitasatospora viridis TaxID=281105 RepID=A0A561UIL2_9ACTN|nr:DUF4097 family beta strand repeat-containing protein [Kitasatospora viridis]TWF99177.1 hypothetical protein FHX73_113018 [Kitasatospora viridis]